jgi:ribosomal protein L11 methyltransferase
MTSLSPETHDAMVASVETDQQSARRLADVVTEGIAAEDVAVSLVDVGQGNWRVMLYFHLAVDKVRARELAGLAGGAAMAKALRFEPIAAKDWVGASLAGLKPVAAGRFVVHGAHDRGAVPANRIGIEIEAALAFGTGHHGTTRGCLLVLDRLCKSLRGGKAAPRSLDLGTGSGVLAIAAARALRARVLASDIDAVAVRAARDNARHNHAGGLVEVVRANGLGAPAIRGAAPFDLVFANILLGPLQRFAAPLTKLVAPGGRIVLSGLLTAQANAARSAYGALRLERRIVLDGWTTLVLKRPEHSYRRGGFKTRPYQIPRSRRRRPFASIARRRRDP